MSIHAADKNLLMENVIVDYKDRPEGSVSKLNTYSDGFKVLGTILNLFSTYKPLRFFGIIAAILAALSVGFAIPVFTEYFATGLVRRFPTLIVCGFVLIVAINSLFTGVVLEKIAFKNRQDFEMELHKVIR